MKVCPNYNSKEWKALLDKAGSQVAAFRVFIKNGYEIPILAEIEAMSMDIAATNPPMDRASIENRLLDTKHFVRDKATGLVKVKYKGHQFELYARAMAALGAENSIIPGIARTVKGMHNAHYVQIQEGQQELFDLPSGNTKPLLLPGFDSFQAQQEVIDVISHQVLLFMASNTTIKGGIFQAAVKDFEDRITKINSTNPQPIYSAIVNNIKDLSNYSFDKLAKLKLIPPRITEGTTLVRSIETEEARTEDEEQEKTETGLTEARKDEWVFQYDAKDNALEIIKKFLAFTPKVKYDKETGKYSKVESVVPNQSVFLSYDQVYEELKGILAGVPNTWEAMHAELTKYQTSKPYIYAILKRFENYKGDIEQLKRQFVSNMSSTYSGFKTILITPRYETDPATGIRFIVGKYFNVIDTDQASVQKVIINNWQGNFKRSQFYKVENNKLSVDYDAVKSYLDRIDEVAKEPTKEGVKELLDAIGISIADSTLTTLVEGSMNRLPISGQFTESSGLFTLIKLRLSGKVDSSSDDLNSEDVVSAINDPMVNNSAVRALARVESMNSDYYYSNTFKDGENNTVYSYTFNKFLTREFNKLMTDEGHVKNLLNITFNKPIYKNEEPIYETWLHLLATSPVFKTVFNISPLDTLKVAGPTTTGMKLTSMSELDLELTKLALIQNSGQRKKGVLKKDEHKDGARVVKYLLTVPSKTTSYVIQGIGHEVKLFFEDNGAYVIDKATREALYSIVATEHNRVLSQQARESKNASYRKGSKLFYFFPTLLDKIKNADGRVLEPTEKIGDKTVEQILKEEVEKILRQDILDKITEWERLGVVEENRLVHVDYNYDRLILNPQTNGNNYNKVTLAAADYVINSVLAKFNTHQTFIDDPAVYFKKDVKTTWDNVEKRLTNLIAPSKDGMLDDTNKHFLSIRLEDRNTQALNIAQLRSRLYSYYEANNIELPYESITGTDAAEYVTLKEELKVMYMYGEISTKMYESLMDRIAKQGDDIVLTREELEKLLLPRKPVYSSRAVNVNDDAVYREYVKSASIVLIPQFTKGLEIDKLRKAMESLENKDLTVRATFDSAAKLGGYGLANIWNEDGTIKDNLDLSKYAVQLERANFGIQQEVPYDEKKDEIVRATQPLKLLFDSLGEVTGFRYNGKSYSGSELFEEYTKLQEQTYKRGLTKLESRIFKNGVFNMPEVIKLLFEEGAKRGYSPAQLSFLKSNLEGTDFSLPFWSHVSNDKEQAMLTSLWTNNVLKQKMPGGSYVLVSEEGILGKGMDTLYTKEYDPTTGLKPMRIAYKKDKEVLEEEAFRKLSKEEQEGYREIVKPAQVIISWNLRDKNGKLLDRSKYLYKDEEGRTFLDTKKVPREILTQFGFRIPNQGHNSMSLIEIVGFLPDTYAGIVIASRNFVTQMGSDFDVDKLYIYNHFLDSDAGGNLWKEENNIQNNIVDIFKSVLYNPKIFTQVVKPLDLGKIKYKTKDGKERGVAVDLKKQQEVEITNYLNPNYDKTKYLQSVDGKAMVGLTSTGNVFSTLLQGKGVFIRKSVIDEETGKIKYVPDFIVFNIDGKEVKLGDLSSPYTRTGRRKNEIHQGLQSAAVDNEKDPVLSYINANPQVSSVANLLINLGLEEEEIYLFLAQPIIREYVNKVKDTRSAVSTSYVTEKDVMEELTNVPQEDKLYAKLNVTNLADVAIGVEDFNKALFDKGESKFTKEEIQTLVLAKFKKLKEYGDPLQRTQNLLNVESKGVGKSMLDLADKRQAIDGALKNPIFANIERIAGELEENGDTNKESNLNPDTITGHAIVNSIYSADDTIKQTGLMPFSLEAFKELIKQYEYIVDRETDADQKYELWKALKAFVYSRHFTEADKKRIFFDSKDNASLNSRIAKLQRTKLKGNPFILRLDLSQVDVSGKTPSLVFYNSAKEEDIEEMNVYQSFVDLVYNQDPEVRSIGEDLIKYFFMNGGTPGAKDWARYIDTNMMAAIGIADFARSVDFNLPETYGADDNISQVLLQLFQHKPYLAPSIKDKSNLVFKDTTLLIPKDKVPREVIRGTLPKVTPVININGTLYKYEGRSEVKGKGQGGDFIYTQLSDRGSKFYTDYNAPAISKAAYKEKVEPEKTEPNTSTDAYTNPINQEVYNDLAGVSLKQALTSISNSNNKYHQQLAKLFLNLEGLIADVPVRLATEDEQQQQFSGRWRELNKDVTFNPNALARNGRLTRLTAESVILKETIHVIHSKLFKNEFKPTETQVAAREGLQKLFNSIRQQIIDGKLSGTWNTSDFSRFEALRTRLKEDPTGKSLTNEELQFLKDKKALYYGLTNVEDFVHEAILEPSFANALNTVKATGDRSMLEQILDFILDVLKGFSSEVPIKEGTALEEAFNYLIMMSSNPNVSGVTGLRLPMTSEHIQQIKNGEKTITNRKDKLPDGKYTLSDGTKVELKYEGEFKVIDKSSTGGEVYLGQLNSTGGRYERSNKYEFNTFAQKEGYKNWNDFELNNKFSSNFINGEQSRHVYSIKVEDQTTKVNTQTVSNSTGFSYNTEQVEALNSVFEFIDNGNPNEFFIIEGKAGTGKTTIAKEVGKRYKNKTILVTALSHKAKGVIKDSFESAGIRAKFHALAGALGLTLDYETGKFVKNEFEEREAPVEKADIIIVDEASMINEEALSLIMQGKQHWTKVIFLGDIGQLPPIRSADNQFYKGKEQLLNEKAPVFKGRNKAKLITRVRQGEESPILPFADYFWENSQIAEPVSNPAKERNSVVTNKGSLIFSRSVDSLLDNIITSFKKAVKDKNPNHIKVVTYRNDKRQTINQKVHNAVFGEGSPDFNEGELLIFNDGYQNRIENATETQVQSVSELKQAKEGFNYYTITSIIDGRPETYDVIAREDKAKYDTAVSNQFKKAFSLKTTNRYAYKAELTKAWTLKQAYANVDYAYAITSHKSQGSTYNIVVVDEGDINSVSALTNARKSESIYTALTRARNVAVVVNPNNTENMVADIESLNDRTQEKHDDIFYDMSVEPEIQEETEKKEVRFKKILNDYEVRLSNISRDISKAKADGDKELTTTLVNRYKEVSEEKDSIVNDNTLANVLRLAEADLNNIDAILSQDVLTANDLTYIRIILGTWTNIGNPEIYDVITGLDVRKNTPKKQELDKIIAKAEQLKRRSDEAHIEIMHKEAEKRSKKPVSREDITQVSDISYGQARFRDISSSDNVVLNVMDRWLREAEFKTTTELNALVATAEELTKKLIEEGVKTREQMAVTFGQVDANGKLTGELVDALSHEYFRVRDLLIQDIQNAPDPKHKKAASERYYKWIAENHIIVDPSKLYTVNDDGIFEVNEDPDYLAELKKQLGEDYDKTVSRAKQLVEEYNEELRLQILYFKDRTDGAKRLEIWQLENSPLVYLDNLMNGLTIRKVDDKVIYNHGWRYIAKRALSQWEDPKYNEIQKNANLKAYYDWYKETLNTLYHYLPYNIRRELKTTEIPNIEKTLIQELHDAGATKYANRTWSALLDSISVSNGEFATGINPATGTFDKEFKFAYLDKINPEHKSYDLTFTLKLFAAQAIGYKFKSQIEDQVRLAEATLKNALEKQMRPDGTPRLDKYGKSTTLKGLRNLQDQLEYVIDVFYGNKKDDKEGKTNITYITPRDKERLAEEVAKINEMEISQASKDAKIRAATNKYTKAFSWSKLGDAILQYVQLKGMGWNVFGGVNNMLFGQMANYNWSATGSDFNDEDMTKAVGIMLRAQTGADKAISNKIEALMIKYNTVKQLRDKIYSATTNYNAARKGIEKIAPYELYAQGEYFVQGQVMVALMNATKVQVVENGETKTIALFDALNDKGEWDTERFGANEKWNTLGDNSVDFKFKLDNLLKKIHGNYDPQSAMLINKNFLGRALIQFRRWIPEGVAQRFETERYDIYLDRKVKGRYRTYGDLGFKQSIKTLVKLAVTGDKAFDDLKLDASVDKEVLKENMKKNLREVYYKLSLVAMYLILSGIDDDDDDVTTRVWKNYAINTILRLEDDIEFYYSPVAMDNITRSFFPAMNIVSDSYKFMDAVVETATGEPYYKSGVHSGESKIFWRGMKLVPFGSSISGLINKTETTESFRK